MEGPRIRRIVTGHDEEGRSVVLSDAPAPRAVPIDGRGGAFVEWWTTRSTPAPIDRASGEPPEDGLHLPPPANGTRLRVPKLFNLRTDPYEYADITSNTYYDWFFHNAYFLYAAQAGAAKFAATFKDFPAVQKPNTFTVDDALKAMSEAGSS